MILFVNRITLFIFILMSSMLLISPLLYGSDHESEEEDPDVRNLKVATEKRVVFSFDGGGVRGFIPLYAAEQIENQIGKPLVHSVDFMTGTSTGGIIVLGLNVPKNEKVPENDPPQPKYSPSDMLDMYTKYGERIFPCSFGKRVTGLMAPLYKPDGLEFVANKYFGETWLSDSITNVVVSAFETQKYQPYFFKSFLAGSDKNRDFKMKYIARATSAAPTFFPPAWIPNRNRESFCMIDGGVFVNNPAICGSVEARVLYPLTDIKDFTVVSFGTGQVQKTLAYDTIKDYGTIKWVSPLIDIMMEGNSAAVDYQLKELLSDIPTGDGGFSKRYYRFNPEISEADSKMDNASEKNMKNLRLIAERQVQERSSDIGAIVSLLKEKEARRRSLLVDSEFALDLGAAYKPGSLLVRGRENRAPSVEELKALIEEKEGVEKKKTEYAKGLREESIEEIAACISYAYKHETGSGIKLKKKATVEDLRKLRKKRRKSKKKRGKKI